MPFGFLATFIRRIFVRLIDPGTNQAADEEIQRDEDGPQDEKK
jgi:hypothetical protein